MCSLFPSIFILAVQKDVMVADLWNYFREEGGWSLTFLRSFNDWEMEEVESSSPLSTGRESNLGLRTNFC